MEIKIGIRQSNRELTLDVDASVDDITAQVNEAISQGTVISLKERRTARSWFPLRPSRTSKSDPRLLTVWDSESART